MNQSLVDLDFLTLPLTHIHPIHFPISLDFHEMLGSKWVSSWFNIPQANRPSGLSDRWIKSIWWKRMMFSTDFNPQENIKKGWFWWQNVRYPLFHSFTWSTFFNLILFEENWKRFAWLYKCFTQWFFSGSVENATGGVWGWEVFVEKPCGIVIL